MGHALAQFLHLVVQDEATFTLVKAAGKGALRGVPHDDSVPIGQNEHQVRGA